ATVKSTAADTSAESLGQRENAVSFQTAELVNLTISVPHPATLDHAHTARLEFYQEMSKSMLHVLSGLEVWDHLPEPQRQQVEDIVSEQVPVLACGVYEAEYLGMAVDFPQFFIWSILRDQQEKDALIKNVGADLRVQFELVASSLQTVDLGLQHLAAAIKQ